MSTTIDERGRVLIPKEMREALGLRPGTQVHLETDGSTVRVRPALTHDDLLDRVIGAITDETADPDAEPIDPLEIKRIWEPRL